MINFEQETVILPIQQKDIFKNSSLLSAPKGRGYFEYLKMFTQINAPSHLNASLSFKCLPPQGSHLFV